MPTSAYWDLARRATHCHVTSSIYFFSTGLTHAVLDIVILVLPLIEVIKMHLPLGQKLAVMALFGFGALCVSRGDLECLVLTSAQCLRLDYSCHPRFLQVQWQFKRNRPQDRLARLLSCSRMQPHECFGYIIPTQYYKYQLTSSSFATDATTCIPKDCPLLIPRLSQKQTRSRRFSPIAGIRHQGQPRHQSISTERLKFRVRICNER
jgi:hypothetical protein